MKVSIITVCLNSVATIEQTIQSVLSQTYKNIEYIVIDGASCDGTCEIIEKYKQKITYYVSEQDHGIYSAMNKGLRHITGDIVGIINSDDWYAEDTIEKVVNTFKQSSCQLVHGKLAVQYGKNKYRIIEERALSDIYLGMVISHPTVFIKKDVYQKYGLFDEQYKSAADYELMLRFFTKGISIVYIPDVLAYFRQGGYSQKNKQLSIEETHTIAQNYIKMLDKDNKEYQLNEEEQYKQRLYRYQIEKKIDDLDEREKQELLYKLNLSGRVVIFGTGSYGMVCYELLQNLSFDFEAWVDNASSKQGDKLLGKSIFSPKVLVKEKVKWIIASKNYEREMINELVDLGITPDNYVTLYDLEKVIMEYDARGNKHLESKN